MAVAQNATFVRSRGRNLLPDIIAWSSSIQIPAGGLQTTSPIYPATQTGLKELESLFTVSSTPEDPYMLRICAPTIIRAFDLHRFDQSCEVRMRRGVDLLLDTVFRYARTETEALKSSSEFAVTVPRGGCIIDPHTFSEVDAAVIITARLELHNATANVNKFQRVAIQSNCARSILVGDEVELIGFAVEFKLQYSETVQNQIKMDLIIAASHRRFLGIHEEVYGGVVTSDKFYLWTAKYGSHGELLLTEYTNCFIPLQSLEGFLLLYSTFVNIYNKIKTIKTVISVADIESNPAWRSDPDDPRPPRRRTPTGSRIPSPIRMPGPSAAPVSSGNDKSHTLGNSLVQELVHIASPVPHYATELPKFISSYGLDSDMDTMA